MRPLVGIDARALSNINKYRGIGRYTAHIVESIISQATDLNFILFGYGENPPDNMLCPDLWNIVDWVEIPVVGKGKEYPSPLEYLTFAKVVANSGVSLFHGIDHNLTPFLKCKSIVTVHDLILLVLRGPYLGPKSYLWITAHRKAAQKASAVIAVSESTRKDVHRLWKIPLEKIHVIYEGVSYGFEHVDHDSLESYLEVHDIKEPYFLYMGGFDPRKNIHNMLLAFKRFLKITRSSHKLVLCGNVSGFEDYLRSEIADMGLDQSILMPGFVSDEDLPYLLSGAEALVFVSVYEGFGLPAVEAMSLGTPVIASRSSSLPEILTGAGVLVDPFDPEDIARAMLVICSDAKFRDSLVRLGLEKAKEFTWEKAASRILELYRLVLEGGAGDQNRHYFSKPCPDGY